MAKLSNGNLKLKECRLLFDGTFNTKSKGLNVNLELELLESRNNAIKVGIRRQVESGLKKLGVDKYAKPEKITEAAMKPLLNKNGMVYMKFKVAGTTAKPTAKLTHPALGSIGDIIKKVAGNVVLEAGKEAAGKALKDGGKSLLKGLKNCYISSMSAVKRMEEGAAGCRAFALWPAQEKGGCADDPGGNPQQPLDIHHFFYARVFHLFATMPNIILNFSG